MKQFKNLPGYMGNKFVKDEHIFVEGKGVFFETKEKAIAFYNRTATGNGVKHKLFSNIIEGIEVFYYTHTNVFD